MSDLRVDTRAIEAKYGLHSPDKQVMKCFMCFSA